MNDGKSTTTFSFDVKKGFNWFTLTQKDQETDEE